MQLSILMKAFAKAAKRLPILGFAGLVLGACADDTAADTHDAAEVSEVSGDVPLAECVANTECEASLGAPGVCRSAACVGGQCVFQPSPGGTGCDDGDPCTANDACAAGACSGQAADCDDHNGCTIDLCQAGVGCAHIPSGGTCDDGDACTTGDACRDGACSGLAVAGCDGDQCGDGTCTGQETCASCALDCSPIGVGECGAACNPTVSPTTCNANFACLVAAGGAATTGACVGQAVACNAKAQTGCGAGETCLPLGGLGVSGVAFICAKAIGVRVAGDACGSQEDCGAKLLCADGACRASCDPASATCTGGVCRDVSLLFGVGALGLGTCDTACGDGACGVGESCASCAADCGACDQCGDGLCGATETCQSCARDCGLCAECGNGICQPGETCLDCPGDCGACAICGDGICADAETCDGCPGDCGTCAGSCGDATCSPLENCTTCVQGGVSDCGACPVARCGDHACGSFEDCASCPGDCGACATTCDNGVCELGETCGNCAADCALAAGIGALGCGPACDPTALITGCGDNHACMPTSHGRLFGAARTLGNGSCGRACTNDAVCGTGAACLPVAGLDVGGLCGADCTPGQVGCADGATCVPKPAAPDEGVCIAGGVCSPFGDTCPGGTSCIPVTGAAELGVCVPSCDVRGAACAADACHVRSDAAWHEGSCVGQASACDPAQQTGCAAGQTCIIVAGPGIGGSARVCSTHVGTVQLGAACDAAPCAPGLLCVEGQCRQACAPGHATCTTGACVDESAGLGLAPATIGTCR